MAKKKRDAVEEKELTTMGAALKEAGFVPPADGEQAAPEILMTYEVAYTYESKEGKQYHQTSIISECRNAEDAHKTIRETLQARGLDPERAIFEETKERPDLLKEVVVEAQMGGDGQAEMFPEPEKPAAAEDERPAIRQVTFQAKIVDVNVKQGDTRLLKIVMLVGNEVPRVNSELLEKFTSSEQLFITVEPFQLTTKDVRPNKKDPVAQAQAVMAKGSNVGDAPEEKVRYTCPHCQAAVETDKNSHPADLKCPACEKEFPIEFKNGGDQDTEEVESDIMGSQEAGDAEKK